MGITLLFTGCTPPSATRYFEKSSLYSSALQYTKKADIIFENELKVMMNVTYLNAVDKRWDNEYENFIVGVYTVDSTAEDNNIDLDDLSFFLSLNERNYVGIEKFSVKHPMFGHLPLMNTWANYYVVKFDKSDDDTSLKVDGFTTDQAKQGSGVKFKNNPTLTLKLAHTIYGQTSLSFALK